MHVYDLFMCIYIWYQFNQFSPSLTRGRGTRMSDNISITKNAATSRDDVIK